MKYLKTTKLFYNEFLYKICFYNSLNTIFRTELQKHGNLSFARERLDSLTESYRNNLPLTTPVFRTVKYVPEEEYLDAKHIYTTLFRSKSRYRIRVEFGGSINIFSNDTDLLDNIVKGLRCRRISMYKPDDNAVGLLLGEENVIISDVPTDWKLKITLGSKKKEYFGFANWIEANTDKIKIGSKALEALKSHGYVDGYYFFLKSEKLLDLIYIMIGDNVRRIDRIFYNDNIDK